MRAGAEVNCVMDADGDTPLHVLQDRDTCRLLLERGADVHAPNTRGHTPLHVAARRGAAASSPGTAPAPAARQSCLGTRGSHVISDIIGLQTNKDDQ